MYSVPCSGFGSVAIVTDTTVPSLSVPVKASIAVGPDDKGSVTLLVMSTADGGALPIGIVAVAGVASVAPRLSVTVKVNVLFPEYVPLGSNLRVAASSGVRT